MQHRRSLNLTYIFLLLAPDYDKSCWLDEKHKLGIDFVNVSEFNFLKESNSWIII